MDKLLTLEEVSVYLNVAQDQVVRMVEEKRLPAYKVGGKFLRFRKDQVDTALGRGGKTPAPPRSHPPASSLATTMETVLDADTLRRERMRELFYAYDFYLACGLIVVIMLVLLFVL